MYDVLPFPDMPGKNTEEAVKQLYNYLIRFKETLEFILSNISIDNLSQDLVDRLNELGADIEKSQNNREDELQQISQKTLTVSDVINSDIFDAAVNGKINGLQFSVNYDTGNLEYTTTEEISITM